MSENKELTARFGANTSGFESGVEKIRQKLVSLNTALIENKDKIKETNDEIRKLKKEQAALAKEMNGDGTKEQRQRMQSLKDQITQANTKLAQFKTTETGLKASIKSVSSELSGQKKETQELTTGTDKLSNSYKSLKGTITAIVAGYGGKKLWEMLIGSNAEMEQYQKSFEVMLGDAERAAELLNDIKNMAAATPLTFTDLTSTSQLLMNYGVGDDEIISWLTRLGDLSSGNAEKLDRISLAYGQMLAKGKVTGEELRQMTEAGVPLNQALADSLGVAGDQLSKMISAGQVGIPELNTAIESLTSGTGRFAGMMETQSQTLNGLLSTLTDNVTNFMRDVGKASFDEIKSVISDITADINRMSADGTLERLSKNIGGAIASLLKVLTSLSKLLIDNADKTAAFVTALIAFKTAVNIGNTISTTVNSFRNLTTATKAATTAQQAFNVAGAANPYVLVAAGITAIAGAFIPMIFNAETAADKLAAFDTSMQRYEDMTALENIVSQYEKLGKAASDSAESKQELQDLQDQLNSTYGKEAEQLDLVNGKYEDQLATLQNLNEEKRATALLDTRDALAAVEEAKKDLGLLNAEIRFRYDEKTGESLADAIDSIYEKYNAGLSDLQHRIIDYYGDGIKIGTSGEFTLDINSNNFDQQKEILEAIKAEILESGEATGLYAEAWRDVTNALDVIDEIAEKEDNLRKTEDYLVNGVKVASKEFGVQANEIEKVIQSYDDLTSANKNLISSLDKSASAFKEQQEFGSLSYNTTMAIVDAGFAACLRLDEETGKVRINAEAYKDLAKAKLQAQIVEIETTISASGYNFSDALKINDPISAAEFQKRVADFNNSEIGASLNAQKTLFQDMLNNLDSYSSSGSFSSFTSASSAVESAIESQTSALQAQLAVQKELRDLTISALDEEIQKRKELAEDSNLQQQIDSTTAQLKYDRLDDFSRKQLEKQLDDLKKQQVDLEWERNITAKKTAVNSWYEDQAEAAASAASAMEVSVSDISAMISTLLTALRGTSTGNNYSSTANITFANTPLTRSQVEEIISDALKKSDSY